MMRKSTFISMAAASLALVFRAMGEPPTDGALRRQHEIKWRPTLQWVKGKRAWQDRSKYGPEACRRLRAERGVGRPPRKVAA